MSRAKLIAFEGIDEVGKTSIVSALAARLASSGASVASFAFPGRKKGSIGEFIYSHESEPRRFSAAATQALHIAAHIDAIEQEIRPAERTCDFVLLDRYWWSAVAYGNAFGVQAQVLSALVEVEALIWGGLAPESIVYVTRSRHYSDLERKILENYEGLASDERTQSRIIRLQNEGSIDDAVENLLAHI